MLLAGSINKRSSSEQELMQAIMEQLCFMLYFESSENDEKQAARFLFFLSKHNYRSFILSAKYVCKTSLSKYATR